MKFNFCLLFAAVVFSNSFLNAQSFEGKIVYQNSFKSKLPSLTDAQLAEMMGTKQDFFIRGGDYRSETNGTFVLWQVYVNSDNKLYTKVASSPALLWNDCSENKDPMIGMETHRNAATILGFACDELVFTTKTGVQKFYFNSNLKMDAKAFVKHSYQNWSAYATAANAIPLKIIIETPQFSVESVATEVLPGKLEDNLFVLPADAQTQKSPY